jgi:hypothetical protein
MREFWAWLGSKLNIRSLNAEQIGKLTFEQAVKGAVADVASGRNIVKSKKHLENAGKTRIFANDNKGTYYEQLKQRADKILSGISHLDRLSRAEEQGRTKGGRRNVEASILLGGQESSVGKNTQERSGSQGEKAENGRKEQERRLIEWAKKVGIFEEYEVATKRKLFDHTGTEAKIYEGKTEDTVVKITYPYQFSNTPLEFLDDRISLHNFLFPETAYKLIGITQKGNAIAFILEQPKIDVAKNSGTINMDFFQSRIVRKIQ